MTTQDHEKDMKQAGKLASIGGYGVRNYAQMETPRGVAFSGVLTRLGSQVASFTQDDDGGAMRIRWADAPSSDDIKRIGHQALGAEAFEVEAAVIYGLLEVVGV